jgi:hypothetical protein
VSVDSEPTKRRKKHRNCVAGESRREMECRSVASDKQTERRWSRTITDFSLFSKEKRSIVVFAMHVLDGIGWIGIRKQRKLFPIYGSELYCFPGENGSRKRESLNYFVKAPSRSESVIDDLHSDA